MSLISTLKTYGQIGVDVLRQAIAPIDATGKTQNSIRYVVIEEEDRLIFLARNYFHLLEKGRRPTSKNPSPAMIENLTEYAKARGMENPKSAAWAIAKTINKEGDKTFRKGGRVLYSDVMDTFTKDLREALAKDFGLTMKKELKAAFK